MPETSPTKPTDDLSWATNEAPEAPPQGRREQGWIPADTDRPGEKPAIKILDWHSYEMGQRIKSAASRAPRIFDDFIDAIDATVPGEVFYVEEQLRPWVYANKTSKSGIGFNITHLRSDARRIYYVQNSEVVAATARPSVAAEVEWSQTFAALGISGGGATDLSTDGQIVVVTSTAASTYQAVVLDAALGTILYQLNEPGASDFLYVAADSSDSEIAFYARPLLGSVQRWDPTSGFQTAAAGFSVLQATKAGISSVLASVGASLQVDVYLYDRSIPAVLLEQTTNVVPATATAVVKGVGGTDDSLFAMMPQSGASPTPYLVRRQDSGVIKWTYNGPAGRYISDFVRMAIDDLYIYFTDSTHLVVVDRTSGAAVFEADFSASVVPTTLESDGHYLWANSRVTAPAGTDRLTTYSIARQRGYWLRTKGIPASHDKGALAVPLTRADGGARL